MKKLLITIMALGFAVAVQAGEIPPAGKITIEGKRPVKFSHQIHTDKLKLDCGVCHHDEKKQGRTLEAIKGMEETGGLKCATCHNKKMAKAKLAKRKTVFHNTCRACHKAGYEGKHGPTKCVGCHGKRKRKAVEGC